MAHWHGTGGLLIKAVHSVDRQVAISTNTHTHTGTLQQRLSTLPRGNFCSPWATHSQTGVVHVKSSLYSRFYGDSSLAMACPPSTKQSNEKQATNTHFSCKHGLSVGTFSTNNCHSESIVACDWPLQQTTALPHIFLAKEQFNCINRSPHRYLRSMVFSLGSGCPFTFLPNQILITPLPLTC